MKVLYFCIIVLISIFSSSSLDAFANPSTSNLTYSKIKKTVPTKIIIEFPQGAVKWEKALYRLSLRTSKYLGKFTGMESNNRSLQQEQLDVSSRSAIEFGPFEYEVKKVFDGNREYTLDFMSAIYISLLSDSWDGYLSFSYYPDNPLANTNNSDNFKPCLKERYATQTDPYVLVKDLEKFDTKDLEIIGCKITQKYNNQRDELTIKVETKKFKYKLCSEGSC